MKWNFLVILVLTLLVLSGCAPGSAPTVTVTQTAVPTTAPLTTGLSTPTTTLTPTPTFVPTTTPSSTSTTTPTATPTPAQGQTTGGTLTKIEGNTLTMTNPQGTITVNVSSATSIGKFTTGTLLDLQVGQFLAVYGTKDANGNITATSITIPPPGQTNPPVQPAGATPPSSGAPPTQGGSTTSVPPSSKAPPTSGVTSKPPGGQTPPAASSTPVAPSSQTQPATAGTLTKIDGNSLTLNTSQGTVRVVVGSTTSVVKFISGTLSDLQVGQFLSVVGTQSANGNITATSITLPPQVQPSPPTSTTTPSSTFNVLPSLIKAEFANGVTEEDKALIIQGISAADFYLQKWFGKSINRQARLRVDASEAAPNVVTQNGEMVIILGTNSKAFKKDRAHMAAHEYVHVYAAYNGLGSTDVSISITPLWFLEGEAEWLSYEIVYEAGLSPPFNEQMLTSLAKEETAPLKSLEKPTQTVVNSSRYALYALAVNYLMRDKPKKVLDDFAVNLADGKGMSMPQAFEKAFNITLDKFYENFESYRKTW